MFQRFYEVFFPLPTDEDKFFDAVRSIMNDKTIYILVNNEDENYLETNFLMHIEGNIRLRRFNKKTIIFIENNILDVQKIGFIKKIKNLILCRDANYTITHKYLGHSCVNSLEVCDAVTHKDNKLLHYKYEKLKIGEYELNEIYFDRKTAEETMDTFPTGKPIECSAALPTTI